ncbi:MAG TPA: alginate lyase family protein [Burkholderiaceae bacterium]|nr:alginate lyase family protein [Burkholderiaceae bacterium]
MPLSQAARLFHTVRYLRGGQILSRIRHRFSSPRVVPTRSASARKWPQPWPLHALLGPGLVGPGTFEFLGERARIGKAADWNDPVRSHLWLYNLHYLSDLNAAGAQGREDELRDLVQRWIRDNPPGQGVGWEPYPLSLRIVNLVKWLARQHAIEPEWLASLATQADALSRRIEFYLLGNHLFANAKALVFAGAFLAGDRAPRWLERGLAILARQVPEQFLPDGGHFERSPMYHAALLADLFDLIELADVSALPVLRARREAWVDAANRGLNWLDAMTHPDGEIAFFNDAAIGIAPNPIVLARHAARLLGARTPPARPPFDLRLLRESGYVRVDLPAAGAALLDIAPLGPDYLPAHGHADTLSFELSLFGTRVFVNSGTSMYGASEERLRQRGTAAHNTVLIDNENSSEVWGGFRVARRARATLHGAEPGPKRIVIHGSHDGYRRLPGRNTHWRRWTFGLDSLQVDDTVTGRFRSAEARYHLHPAVVVQQLDPQARRAVLRLPGGQSVVLDATGASLQAEPATWHPRFGVSVANRCLVLRFEGGQVGTRLQWQDAA